MLTFALSSFENVSAGTSPVCGKKRNTTGPSSVTGEDESKECAGGASNVIIPAATRQAIESALVDHVKRGIPLECLRYDRYVWFVAVVMRRTDMGVWTLRSELAEEIGFIDIDIEQFKRLLELHVVAPRLGDLRLIEDDHAWGQVRPRRL